VQRARGGAGGAAGAAGADAGRHPRVWGDAGAVWGLGFCLIVDGKDGWRLGVV